MENRTFYNEILIDHNMHPGNKYQLKDPQLVLEGKNPSCGDDIFLQLTFDGDVIKEGSFVGDGCAISQASADMMLDLVIGKTKKEALELSDLFLRMIQGELSAGEEERLEEAICLQDISHMPSRVKCAVLGWRTLKEAIERADGSEG